MIDNIDDIKKYYKTGYDEMTRLERHLVFPDGMSIPLMSEFSNYAQGDTETKKQDCEQKAFKRLAKRLKAEFSRLFIMVLLDGPYPNGPIMEVCRKNRWDFR